MQYLMKSGALSIPAEDKKLAQIKSAFAGAKMTISIPGTGTQYRTNIDIIQTPEEKSSDIHSRSYQLQNENGEIMMEAHPGYAKNEDSEIIGWPLYCAPKVDHAEVCFRDKTCLLVMHNSQNYSLQAEDGKPVVQIMHRGISGGWSIDTAEKFSVPEICALFIFCRYIEQENEFTVV